MAPVDTSSNVKRGTLVGGSAILIWSTLAALTTLSRGIPPFQLLAMSFAIAFLIGLGLWFKQGGGFTRHFRLPARVWALGIYGLFGYHFAYFMALRLAPPVEANLINYLWPLLIVVFAAFLPGERLRGRHIVGVLAGFAGAALLVTGGRGFSFEPQYAAGYAFAVACGVIWSSYSVLSRLAGDVPTSAVGAFCAATAVLALACHLLFEETMRPVGIQWLAIIGLGLGPVGLAFYVWDYGVKRGNIQTLGVLAYATPLLSTLLLIALGLADFSWVVAAACGLIVGGAFIAGRA